MSKVADQSYFGFASTVSGSKSTHTVVMPLKAIALAHSGQGRYCLVVQIYISAVGCSTVLTPNFRMMSACCFARSSWIRSALWIALRSACSTRSYFFSEFQISGKSGIPGVSPLYPIPILLPRNEIHAPHLVRGSFERMAAIRAIAINASSDVISGTSSLGSRMRFPLLFLRFW